MKMVSYIRLISNVLITFFVISVVSTVMKTNGFFPESLYFFALELAVYFLTAFLSNLLGKLFSDAIIIALSVVCVYELYLGIGQILGLSTSNHFLFKMTGSFPNPGPYGAFLSISVSLIVSFHYKYKDSMNKVLSSNYFLIATKIIVCLALIILALTHSRAAILSLLCSAVLFVAGVDVIRTKVCSFIKRHLLLLISAVFVVGAGFYLIKKPSADGRLFIDRMSIKAMSHNDWKGAGLDRFGGEYGEAQASFFKRQIEENGQDPFDWKAINRHERLTSDCPTNAFNEYLNMGIELGAVSLFLFVAIIVIAIVISFKKGTIWCYGILSLAVFALFSYPLHIRFFQILLAVLLAAGVADRNQTGVCVPDLMFTASAFFITGLFLALNTDEIRKYIQAEKMWKETRGLYDQKYYEFVVEDCDSIGRYMSHDRSLLFAYGESLNKMGNWSKSDSVLMKGAEISADPVFWTQMGDNSLATGDFDEAERCYKHAFYMVPNRLYPLYLLAKLYNQKGDTEKFLFMADKVEFFIPKIESANTEKMRNEINDMKKKCLDSQR